MSSVPDAAAQAMSMVSLGLAFIASFILKRPLIRVSLRRISFPVMATMYSLLALSLLNLRIISPLSALISLTLALSGPLTLKFDISDSLAIGVSASLAISAFLPHILAEWAWPALLILIVLSPLSWIAIGRKGKDKIVELGSYETTLIFLALHALAQLSYVANFLPYYITFDPVVHQYWARVLVRAPSMYNGDYYAGFHGVLAFAYWLTGAPAEDLVLTSFWLSIASLLLIYSAFKSLPWREFSLLIYGGFSSFVWIGGVLLGLDNPSMPVELTHLTQNSLFWREPLFLWGLPVNIAVGLLAYSSSFLGFRKEEPIKAALLAILTVSLFSVHVVEAVLLVLLITLGSSVGIVGRWSALGGLAGGILSLIISALLKNGAMLVTSTGLIILSVIAIILLQINFPRKLRRIGVPKVSGPELEISISIVLATALVLWTLRLRTVWNGEELGFLPWYLYPVLLGMSAFLAIPSMRRGPFVFVGLVVISLLVGRAVSMWNAVLSGVFGIIYWEYRFVPYVAMALSPLAGRTLASLFGKGKRLLPIVLIILVIGTASKPIALEFWRNVKDGAGPRMDLETISAAKELPGGILLLLSNYTMWATLYGEPSIKALVLPFWLSEGPEVAYYSLNSAMGDHSPTIFATAGEASVLWSKNSSRSYSRSFIWPGDPPIVRSLRTTCPPVPKSGLALIFPNDTYLRRRAMAVYELIREHLPVHTIYLADDPTAPEGIYLGSPSETIRVSGEFPEDPESPLYVYKIGPWLNGLRLIGDMGLLVSSFELDEGRVSLEACPERRNGTLGIAFQYINKSEFSFAGVDLGEGTVLAGKAGKLLPIGRVEIDCCLNMSLLGDGTTLVLKIGKDSYNVGRGRIGVVGISAQGYLGDVNVEVSGIKRQEVPAATRVIDVVGNGGDWGVGELVDSYLHGNRKVKLNPPSWLRGECDPPSPQRLYFASTLRGDGSIRLSGLLVRSDPLLPLSGKEVEVEASGMEIDGELGKGFYVEVRLTDARLGDLGPFDRLVVWFRTPLNLSIKGEAVLKDMGENGRLPGWWSESVKVEDLSATILAVDKTILFKGSMKHVTHRLNNSNYIVPMMSDLAELMVVGAVAWIMTRLLLAISSRARPFEDRGMLEV